MDIDPFAQLVGGYDNLLYFGLGVLVLGAMLRWVRLRTDVYLNTPTYRNYVARHPEAATGDGVKCIHCGSANIRNRGYQGEQDRSRLHVCESCGRTLYRTTSSF